MAGAGSRFEQAGYTFPKPLIDVRNKPMIQVVVDNLNIDANYIYIVQKKHREQYNLDTAEWKWGHYDIIINFGLYYHLEKYHKEHLENCINNCDLMFFETVVYDSFETGIYFRYETGYDQSLSNNGGTPSTLYVESIFNENNKNYEKFKDSSLNAYNHHYDWPDADSKIFNQWSRRFWIVNNVK
jgi:hypothetical protein